MTEGIVSTDKKDEEIADFLLNGGYPHNILPITCIMTGSRAYGLASTNSDRDYIGIHLMDTNDVLEHPSYRGIPLVVRRQFNEDLESELPGQISNYISLDSFEIWKFIDMIKKGSFVTYELLHMPVVHHDPGANYMIELCQSALTNRIGKIAKGFVFHTWKKRKNTKKDTVMAYYRLLQASLFLREGAFAWLADDLWAYGQPLVDMSCGKDILEAYMDPDYRQIRLTKDEVLLVGTEIEALINEVEKAMITTRLPDQCPKKVLAEILRVVKTTRAALILKGLKMTRITKQRREFTKFYGTQTTHAVAMMAKGWDSGEIATRLDISVGTVMAIRANLTRGTYEPYATGTGNTGTCLY